MLNSPRVHYIVLTLLTIATFGIDVIIPLGVAGGIAYIIPVLLTYFSTGTLSTIVFAISGTLLTVVGSFLSATVPHHSHLEVLFNRTLSIIAIWLGALFLLGYKRVYKVSIDRENRFRALFEGAVEGILLVDEEGRIAMMNPQCEKLFGYKEKELLGHKVEVLVPANLRMQHETHRQDYLKNPRARPMGQGYDLYAQRKDGSQFPVDISLSYINTREGMFVTAFITDITERKKSEEELRKSEQDLREERNFVTNIIDTTTALIVVLDNESRIVRFNKAAEVFTGYSRDNVFGKSIFELGLIPEEEREQTKQQSFNQLVQNKTSFSYENHWIDHKGEWRLISWSNASLLNNKGEIDYVISAGIDISERKEMERKIMVAVFEGEEKERRRLASELHDGLTPVLASVKNYLQAIQPDLEEVLKEKQQAYFTKSLEQLDEAMSDLRNMSRNLRPRILEDKGLVEALQELSNKTSNNYNVDVKCHVMGLDEHLDQQLEMTLYRVTQELLNNAIKHAYADRIIIQLMGHERSLVLTVEDNGVGFDVDGIEKDGSGLGLKNMESRVRAHYGEIHIESAPGTGTIIHIEIPLIDKERGISYAFQEK